MPFISFKNVTVDFADEPGVIDNLTFNAPAKQHTVLKGESGSGKSTILKLILGFLVPAKGSISFQNNNDHKSIRQYTAWLPQDLNMGDGTTTEIIQKPFSFKLNGNRQISDSKIRETLKSLGISENHLDKKFSDLSTGQRQRVGLAICYFLDKPLLLLDEPTSALDQVSKQKAADLLINSDRTIISTSHDAFWVDLADNVIELN